MKISLKAQCLKVLCLINQCSRFFSNSVFVFSACVLLSASPALSSPYSLSTSDFDGDGLSDLVVYNSTLATFGVRFSSSLTHQSHIVGRTGTVPVSGDFTGTGVSSLSAFDRSNAEWFFKIFRSGAQVDEFSYIFGNPADIPVAGHYRGNDCIDIATFNRQTTNWLIADCTSTQQDNIPFGHKGGIPVPADYDGDGKDDLATFNQLTGVWAINLSANAQSSEIQFGLPGDIPIPADFNGDGVAQLAIHRPTTQQIYVRFTNTDTGIFPFSKPGEHVVVMDVDGDARADFSSYDSESSTWDVSTSTLAVFNDVPSHSPEALPLARAASRLRAVDNDFFANGSSSLVLIGVENGINAWNVLSPSGLRKTIFFGFPTDKILSGDPDGDLKSQPIVVRENPSGFLSWFIYKNGAAQEISFGLNGDTPILGDFDCDGKDDLTVVRNLGGLFYWFFRNSTNGSVSEPVLWGASGDNLFAADTTGDGCDEVIITRVINGNLNWFAYSPYDNTASTVLWGLNSDLDVPYQPLDFDGDGSADPAIVRTLGDVMNAYINVDAGSGIKVVSLGTSGEPIVGHFTGFRQAEFAVLNEALGETQLRTITPNGVAADMAINLDPQFFLRSSRRVLQEEDTLGGAVGAGCVATRGPSDFQDGKQGALWKPESEGVPNHAPVILLQNYYNGANVTVLSNSGEVISGVQRTNCCSHNGGRAHFWLQKSAGELDDFAPLTIKIESGGAVECRIVPNPHQRYD